MSEINFDSVLNEIEKSFDEEVKFLQSTIQIDTVQDYSNFSKTHAFGENLTLALDDFLAHASANGFHIANIDNMVGYAQLGDENEMIGILCHLDTVPYNDLKNWIAHPTEAKIIDGVMYGRGTTDDKGPTVAAYYALLALKRAGVKINKRFRMIIGLDEESGFKCVKRYLKSEDIPKFSFSPDAKFPAVYGEKGIYQFTIKRSFSALGKEPVILLGMTAGERHNIVPDTAICYFGGKDIAKIFVALDKLNLDYEEHEYFEDMLKITVKGKSVHAMHPDKGINAIQRLFAILTKLDFAPSELKLWIGDMYNFFKMDSDGKSFGIAMQDDISSDLSINFATIRYNSKELIAQFDIRYPVTINPEFLDNAVVKAVGKLGVMMEIDTHKIPLYIDKNSDEVKILVDAYASITGDKSEPITIGGGTYARAFPNALSFGADMPNDPELAHECNERISLDKLKTVTKIYAKALYELNRK